MALSLILSYPGHELRIATTTTSWIVSIPTNKKKKHIFLILKKKSSVASNTMGMCVWSDIAYWWTMHFSHESFVPRLATCIFSVCLFRCYQRHSQLSMQDKPFHARTCYHNTENQLAKRKQIVSNEFQCDGEENNITPTINFYLYHNVARGSLLLLLLLLSNFFYFYQKVLRTVWNVVHICSFVVFWWMRFHLYMGRVFHWFVLCSLYSILFLSLVFSSFFL